MSPLKTMIYCTLGTVLEWYDFAIFGVLSPILSKVFFPQQTKTTALLLVFTIFATGFLMRPIGGIVFGHIGDRYGRKKAIIWSISIMACSTTFIGLLPTSNSHLYWSAIILVILRLLQGFSAGGEFAGMITFASEISPNRRFFFYQAIVCVGIIGGFLLGQTVGAKALSLSLDSAWRIPFLLSVFLGIVAWYLRVKALESPVFAALKDQSATLKLPIKAAILHYYPQLIACCLMGIAGASTFYFTMVYYPAYAHQHGLSDSAYLHMGMMGSIILIAVVLIVGWLMTFKRALAFILLGFIAFVILPIPTLFITSHHTHYAPTIYIIYMLIYGLFESTVGAFVMPIFPNQVRQTAMGIISNVCVLFGGTLPMLSVLLVKLTGLDYAASFYMVAAAMIGLINLYFVNRFVQRSLKHREIA